MNKPFYKIIILVLVFCSCSLKNNLPVKEYKPTNFPTDGSSTIEILKNKSMVVGINEDGTSMFTLKEDANHCVIRFQFKKDSKQNENDSGYKEILIFEIDNSKTSKVIVNKELQSTKMLSGMFCFCKGRAGLYEVNDGRLDLTINKLGEISFTLNYKLKTDSEVTKTISVVDNALFLN